MSEFRSAWRVDVVKAVALQDYLNEISRQGMTVRDLFYQGSPVASPGDTILAVSFKNVKAQGLGGAIKGVKHDQLRYEEQLEITGRMEEHIGERPFETETQLTVTEESSLLEKQGGPIRKAPNELNSPLLSEPPFEEPNQQVNLPADTRTLGGLEETGQRSPSQRRGSPKAVKVESPSAKTWRSYQSAYQARWGVEPLPNARNWALISQVVAKVGKDNAPGVASFFLTHSDRLYVNAKHPLTLLSRDSDKLYAEWRTNRPSTSTEANKTDRTSANYNAMNDYLRESEK